MKITLLSFDLSRNAVGRLYPLARVLQRRHEIEIVGPVFGEGIYAPYAAELDARTVRGRRWPAFWGEARRLLAMISGDVIYALKPRPASFGLALLHKWRRGTPVVLDIEDWEVGEHLSQGWRHFVQTSVLRGWFQPNGFQYTLPLEALVRAADHITVSSRFLQRRFGGTLLPYGPDTAEFDPARPALLDRSALRRRWKLPPDDHLILFTGTPNPHKGLSTLIAALHRLNRPELKLLLVGSHAADPQVRALRIQAGDQMIYLPAQPHHRMPELLALADLVALPQRDVPNARAQVPAKLYEAMAMAKPIVASAVSDLPEILAGCGYLCPPDDPAALADTLARVLADREEAARRGAAARSKCIREYSWDAMEKILARVFEGHPR